MPFNREEMSTAAARLANEGIWIGTSSWKYPGWLGQLYTDDRYVYRGRFAESRFNRLCLSEYAEVFRTVCVDAAYYNFPSPAWLDELSAQVPADFRFAFKVTDQITIKRFPNLPRFGPKAGMPNADFLNAGLFASDYLGPCQPHREKVGLLIFEFSRFYPEDFGRGREFLPVLDQFLASLPKGWPYGVEIRNRTFLHSDYFALLAQHGVAHIYNSWQDMPGLEEQVAMPESLTAPQFTGARLLLRPGRKYEEAVKLFGPYREIKDPYPEGRRAAANLIDKVRASGGRTKGFLYVNNRFEGNALETIHGLVERVGTRTTAE